MISMAVATAVLVAHAHLVLEFSKFDSELPCKMYVVLLLNSDLVFALCANLQAIVFLYTYSLTIFYLHLYLLSCLLSWHAFILLIFY
jgi:hypothetical protein